MLNIFLLCQAFFGYAEPFSALPSIFLLCRAVHSRAEKYTAEQKKNTEYRRQTLTELKSAQHSRKLLGRASPLQDIRHRNLSDLDYDLQGHSDFDALYLCKGAVMPYVAIKHK